MDEISIGAVFLLISFVNSLTVVLVPPPVCASALIAKSALATSFFWQGINGSVKLIYIFL